MHVGHVESKPWATDAEGCSVMKHRKHYFAAGMSLPINRSYFFFQIISHLFLIEKKTIYAHSKKYPNCIKENTVKKFFLLSNVYI